MVIVTIEVQKRAVEIPKNQKENVLRLRRRRWHLNWALKCRRNSTRRDWRGFRIEEPMKETWGRIQNSRQKPWVSWCGWNKRPGKVWHNTNLDRCALTHWRRTTAGTLMGVETIYRPKVFKQFLGFHQIKSLTEASSMEQIKQCFSVWSRFEV